MCTCLFKWNRQLLTWWSTLAPLSYSLSLCLAASPQILASLDAYVKAQSILLSDSLPPHITVLREVKFLVQRRADKVSSWMEMTSDWYCLPGILRERNTKDKPATSKEIYQNWLVMSVTSKRFSVQHLDLYLIPHSGVCAVHGAFILGRRGVPRLPTVKANMRQPSSPSNCARDGCKHWTEHSENREKEESITRIAETRG